MLFISSLSSRRIILISILIILVLLSGLWYLGGRALKIRQDKEAAENAQIVAEYDRIQALINQKKANGESFERFSSESLGKPYTSDDLILGKEDSSIKINLYAQEIRKSLLNIAIVSRNPMLLVLEVHEQQNSQSLQELSNLANRYEQTTNDLLVMEIPPSALTAHLRLINNTREMASILKSMAEVNIEPIKAFEASDYFMARIVGLGQAFTFLNNYFIDKNITFSSTDQIAVPFFTE